MRLKLIPFVCVLLLLGCGGATTPSITPPSFALTQRDTAYTVLPTYDKAGQVVEPDVLYIAKGWNGFKYWMVAAPYPYDNSDHENASIWVTNELAGSGTKWEVPPGVTNPVIPLPIKGWHNQDQSIFLDTDGTMYLYYLASGPTTFAGNTPTPGHVDPNSRVERPLQIRMVSSKDGWKTISAPRVLLSFDSLTFNPLVSTVTRDPASGTYYLWTTNAAVEPHSFVRFSATSAAGPFVQPQSCPVANIPYRRDLWEQNIYWSSDSTKLLALVTLADGGTGGGNTTLHFMFSTDVGQSWDLDPTPILLPRSGQWDSNHIYRGCLVPSPSNNGLFHIWYSADNDKTAWHVGHAEGIPKFPTK